LKTRLLIPNSNAYGPAYPLHRVSPPTAHNYVESDVIREQFSIVYFCKADRDTSAGTLREFVVGDDAVFTEMTALEYHQKRLLSAY